jgi:hypothetical protein
MQESQILAAIAPGDGTVRLSGQIQQGMQKIKSFF